MKLAQHVAASLPLGLAVRLATGSTGYALASVLASIFIDLDHIPDYLIAKHGWHGLGDFFATCDRADINKVHLALHAWEWPILICGGWLAGLVSPWLAAIGFGFAYHLAFDQAFNRLTLPGFYWIAYRAGKGFASERLLCLETLAVVRQKTGPAPPNG
jgi:hypothetical protein